jgi:hypothetical protein
MEGGKCLRFNKFFVRELSTTTLTFMDEADIQTAKTQGSSHLKKERKRMDVMALIHREMVYYTLLLPSGLNSRELN